MTRKYSIFVMVALGASSALWGCHRAHDLGARTAPHASESGQRKAQAPPPSATPAVASDSMESARMAREEAPTAPSTAAADDHRERAQEEEAPAEALRAEGEQAAPAPSRRMRTRQPAKRAHKKSAEGYGLGSLGVLGTGRGGGGSGAGYGRGVGMLMGGQLSTGLALGGPLSPPPADREGYKHTPEAEYVDVDTQPLSTFSVDVDTASYSNVRRILREGRLPPKDAVRVEELLNYFDYTYGAPAPGAPFALHTEVSDCPWNPAHRLVHLGLKTQPLADRDTPARNLVFLLDVSGSMNSPDKLPLLKQGMAMLARNLRRGDSVSIVVYAGASGLVLPPTPGDHTNRILSALSQLEAGGSTAGSAGIELAYRVAQQSFVKGGINRVILATDGDFNVGMSSEGELARLIAQKRKTGIFLTVLGFGRGNLQDARMETLADKGNGHYAYIDSTSEARKVLVREAGSTLVTVAKDVKLQVEFNPAHVQSYRLIGYENRKLAARDFNDDKKDAGEVGAGHSVTALYEVVPAGQASPNPAVDPLRYQQPRLPADAVNSGELLTLKVRYKHPAESGSKLLTLPVLDRHLALSSTSDAFRFAAAVAGFGLKLRESDHAKAVAFSTLQKMAHGALGSDPHGDRAGLLEMMSQAQKLGAR